MTKQISFLEVRQHTPNTLLYMIFAERTLVFDLPVVYNIKPFV